MDDFSRLEVKFDESYSEKVACRIISEIKNIGNIDCIVKSEGDYEHWQKEISSHIVQMRWFSPQVACE